MHRFKFHDIAARRSLPNAPGGPGARWIVPESAMSVDVEFPTDRIRLLHPYSGDNDVGQIVAFAGATVLFRPIEGSEAARLFGADAVLCESGAQYMLDLPQTVVRPSAQWIERFAGDAHGPKLSAARKQLLADATFVIRDNIGPHLVSLLATMKFVDPIRGEGTFNMPIDMPHPIADLEHVSGPSPTERFYRNPVLDEARSRCRSMRLAQEAAAAIEHAGDNALRTRVR